MFVSKYGKYVKEEGEDMASIVQGIAGKKGRVHVHFGQVLEDEQDLISPEKVSQKIDQQITANYRLYPSNFTAYQELFGSKLARMLREHDALKPEDFSDKNFLLRLARVPEELRHQFLAIYANPVMRQYDVSALAEHP